MIPLKPSSKEFLCHPSNLNWAVLDIKLWFTDDSAFSRFSYLECSCGSHHESPPWNASEMPTLNTTTVSVGTIMFSVDLFRQLFTVTRDPWWNAWSVHDWTVGWNGTVVWILGLFRVGDSALDSVARFSTQKIPWSAPESLLYSERHVSLTRFLCDSCVTDASARAHNYLHK